MTEWEALTYRDEPYVRVKPTERGRGELGEDADVASLLRAFRRWFTGHVE